jgi:uncharacterized protein YjiS (DUF1127 family)
MPSVKSTLHLRSRSQIEPARRISLNINRDRALVIQLSRESAPARPAGAMMSAVMVKAIATFSQFAGHTFPNLLLATTSWIIAEMFAGCAAYAEAMYGIPLAPELAEPAPAEIPPRRAPNRLSLVSIHARDDFANPERPAYAALPAPATARALARPGERRGKLSRWRSALRGLIDACHSTIRRAQARRQMIAELRELDDRSLRDIGVSRCDIEHVARYGTWRE